MLFNSIVSRVLLLLLTCLILTTILELFFAVAFRVKKHNLLIVVLAQIVTNPIVVSVSNYIYYSTGAREGFLISLFILEIIAIAVEGVMYKFFFRGYSFINPFVLSLILNVISFLTGVILYGLTR